MHCARQAERRAKQEESGIVHDTPSKSAIAHSGISAALQAPERQGRGVPPRAVLGTLSAGTKYLAPQSETYPLAETFIPRSPKQKKKDTDRSPVCVLLEIFLFYSPRLPRISSPKNGNIRYSPRMRESSAAP